MFSVLSLQFRSSSVWVLFLAFFLSAISTAQSYTFDLEWGDNDLRDGQFNFPEGVAVDGSGNVYVADTFNNRIQKFDSSGVFISKWGTNGTGDGQFDRPFDVAVDGSGNVYIADYLNDRIQKFNSSGTFISKWGTSGSGDGQFDGPIGVIVDGSGNIYVAEAGNDRIQKFDSSGTYVTKWGSNGAADGQFSNPYDVTVDGSGNILVADFSNNRIQKFDSSGTFISKWGTPGTGDGQFNSPISITVDGSGNVLVADADNARIQKFDSAGVFITKWGSDGTNDGQFSFPVGVAADGSDNVYVSGESTNRIQKFNSSGVFITKWGSSNGAGDGQFSDPTDVAVDGSGNVFVVDASHNRIQKFTSTGTYLTEWGSFGTNDGQFDRPYRVIVDDSDNIYVSDSGNDRIQKFDTSGTFLAKWGSPGTNDGEFTNPSGMAVGDTGDVFVGDHLWTTGKSAASKGYTPRVQKFDSSGSFLTKWGSPGTGDGEFLGFGSGSIPDVSINDSGEVYAIDVSNDRIQKFDSSGTFLAKWGSSGLNDGEFTNANGMAVDSSGNIFVVDTDIGAKGGGTVARIQKFDSDGNFYTKWGSVGSGDGEFSTPYGVAVDASGNVYVADTLNDRIQKFSPPAAPVVTIDLLSTDDTTPALSGTINDAAATISVMVDGQTNSASNLGSTWTLADDTLSELANGVYNVAVVATDTIGVQGTDNTSDELIIGSSMPVADLRVMILLSLLLVATGLTVAQRRTPSDSHKQ